MEIKYYKAGIACRSLTAKAMVTSGSIAVIPFKDTNGTLHTNLSFNGASAAFALDSVYNLQIFSDIQNVYASSDSTFDIDEYSAENVVGITSRATATGTTGRTFRLSVYNDTANPITVNSFKFEKSTIYAHSATRVSALVFWVKLDSPATINPGETKDFVVDINFLNE